MAMTARLTTAQMDALKKVESGEVYGQWRSGPRPLQWFVEGFWQPASPVPYQALRTRGLIYVSPANSKNRSEVSLTDEGRQFLDLSRQEATIRRIATKEI